MSGLIIVVVASLIVGLLSLSVGLVLIQRESWAFNLARYGTPFAAGVLLMAARDLIPHGIEEGVSATGVITSSIVAIVVFFLIEKGSRGFHHHHEEDLERESTNGGTTKGWLFVLGDIFHNFVDGISLGGAFLISANTGIITSMAIAAHELPQKVGEFGTQLKNGFTRKQTVIRNLSASFTTLIGAVFAYQFGSLVELPMGYLYGGIAGFFIYISLSDIVPTIHLTEKTRYGFQTLALLFGLVIGGIVSTVANQYTDTGDHKEGEVHQQR